MSRKNKKPEPKKPELNPLIGLELTFSNEATKRDIGDDGIINYQAGENYKKFLTSVEDRFSQYFNDDYILNFTRSETNKDLGDKVNLEDLKIVFKNNLEDDENKEFWINVTRDPKVIEIQTKPFMRSKIIAFKCSKRGFCQYF